MAAGSSPPYGRLSETVVMGRGPWLVVVIACKTRFTLVNDLDNHIRIAYVGYPNELWSGHINGSRPDVYALKIRMRMTRMSMRARMTMRAMCYYKMCATCHRKMRATCSQRISSRYVHFAFVFPLLRLLFAGFVPVFLGQGACDCVKCFGKTWAKKCLRNRKLLHLSARRRSWKSTDKLSVKEFRDRFCIPNGVIVEFLNGEDVVSTEKAEQDTVIFSKEQFNAGLRFLCRRCSRNSSISPRFHPPSFIPTSSGC
ncbi:hypothetical protein CK203_079646 [Vitis vinifera]|uniref:Uncharacterized protein n=1 Tax=Vitis vinifera TaxID=29760 RepID=A0A438DL26_VITVI|nr:hypothetical protein CK203_079646 [Vitis vinifera]